MVAEEKKYPNPYYPATEDQPGGVVWTPFRPPPCTTTCIPIITLWFERPFLSIQSLQDDQKSQLPEFTNCTHHGAYSRVYGFDRSNL